MTTTTFKTACAEVTMRANGVVYVNNFPMEATLEEAKEHVKTLKEQLGAHYPMLVLTDIRRIKKTRKEVRDYYASDEASEATRALAVLTKSGLSKIIGNLFLKFSSPKFPTKIFTNKEKAMEWLTQLD